MGPTGRALATLCAIASAVLLAGRTVPAGSSASAFAQSTAPPAAAPRVAEPPPPPPTYTLAGSLELREKGKAASDRTLAIRNTVVVFEPARNVSAPRPVNVEMTTVKKEFSPRLLVVPVGSTVRFPNLDPILHNVFSISGKNSFDLGLLGKGPGKAATFRESGIVRVFCNVHHAMFAYVYVVGTPHWTTAGDDGAFRLAGLPGGPGKLTVWNERSAPATSEVTLPRREPLRLGVEITMPRIPPHKNKLGKTYGGQNYG